MEFVCGDVADGPFPGGGRIPVDDVFRSRSVPKEEAVICMRVELRGAFTGLFDSDIGTKSTEMADVGATTGPGGIWNVFEA
jgi:hypothetical protein